MFIAFSSLKSVDNQDAVCPGKPVLHSLLWGVGEVGRGRRQSGRSNPSAVTCPLGVLALPTLSLSAAL